MVKLAGIPAFDPGIISCLEGSDKYTIVYFNDGRKRMVAMTLLLVASQLPTLIRIHKLYAIAVSGIGHVRWVSKLANKRFLVDRIS